jgi:hypothetical protein
LRDGAVVDFRGSEDEARFGEALTDLIKKFEDSPFNF